MPKWLSTAEPDFPRKFASFLTEKREVSAEVDTAVAGILRDVRNRGDAALFDLSQKFDHIDLKQTGIRVTAAKIGAAVAACPAETLDALKLARDRIVAHHQRQLPKNDSY